MSSLQPLVSIGLPVYNGEKYLKQSIDSLLAQTYKNIELIICDNASSDRTSEICLEYAKFDGRIRYQRNQTNIGGANNHNLTFELAQGKYFRWASYDDLCAPDLIEKCVNILEKNPSIVICYSNVVSIDEKGNQLEVTSRNNGSSPKSFERFSAIASSRDFCEETYGVIRANIFDKTQLQQNYTGSDRTLMCELSLYGQFYEIQEPLFFKRFHPGNIYQDWRTRMAWFNPNINGKIVFPFWVQFVDYLRTIKRVPNSKYEKFRCYLFMGKWLFFVNGLKMIKDVLYASYMLMHSPKWRQKKYADTNNWA
ncbi:MAG: glycosyltransferase family 2 protein [Ardenticatenaceae bacterium]|nr:glycosyltransferase family 2 protein [Ardenticatenaceae bacterium]